MDPILISPIWLLPFALLCILAGWLINKFFNEKDAETLHQRINIKTQEFNVLSQKMDDLKNDHRIANDNLNFDMSVLQEKNLELINSTGLSTDNRADVESISEMADLKLTEEDKLTKKKKKRNRRKQLKQIISQLRLEKQKLSSVPQALYIEKNKAQKEEIENLNKKVTMQNNKNRQRKKKIEEYKQIIVKLKASGEEDTGNPVFKK